MQCVQNKNKLSFKTNPIVIRFRKHDWNQGRCPAHVPPVPRPPVGLLHVAGHLVRDTPLHQNSRDQEGSQWLVWRPRQVSRPDLILLHSLAASQTKRILQQKLKTKYKPWDARDKNCFCSIREKQGKIIFKIFQYMSWNHHNIPLDIWSFFSQLKSSKNIES